MNNSGIAVFTGNVNGTVQFITHGITVDIIINLRGLTPNSHHGFHVHTYGDLSDGCNSACAHFNPFGNTHGCPGMENRHVGDLGNIQTDLYGNAMYKMTDNVITLTPGDPCCIIGRMLIIHQDRDDCGMGLGDARAESLKTGNAGKRIACAVIGFAKGC
jgi:Cu-Zn family superoxide dismutase